MKKMLLFVVFLQLCHADDIYLKSGVVFYNVKIIGQSEKLQSLVIDFLFNGKANFISQQYILKIDSVPYDETKPSTSRKDSVKPPQIPDREDSVKAIINKFRQTPKENDAAILQTNYKQPNIHWLVISVLSFGLSWDFFSRAGDYQRAIDMNNKISELSQTTLDNGVYKSGKTRMIVLGIVSIGSGIISAVHAFEKVEIKTDGQSLSLAVNF